MRRAFAHATARFCVVRTRYDCVSNMSWANEMEEADRVAGEMQDGEFRILARNPDLAPYVDALTTNHLAAGASDSGSRDLLLGVRFNGGLKHLSTETLWLRAWNARPDKLRESKVMKGLKLVPPPSVRHAFMDAEEVDKRVGAMLDWHAADAHEAYRRAKKAGDASSLVQMDDGSLRIVSGDD